MKQPDIVALGEPLVEMVRTSGEPGGPATYSSDVGGDALNALVAAARQGASTGLISSVGNDPFGSQILTFCHNEAISTEAVMTVDRHPTGLCFIHPDPKDRHFFYARQGSAASHFGPEDLPEQTIAKAKVLHVTGVSQAISQCMREAVRRAAEVAKSHHTLVSYDLNIRPKLWSLEDAKACVDGFLPLADIVLPSDDEAQRLLGTCDPEAILTFFGRFNPLAVILKRGAEGVIVRTSDEDITVRAPSVDAIDSSGAGDSFAGACLAYFLE
ncbi:MAG: sugar kinase, partial [Pseudomonadota bacterium]